MAELPASDLDFLRAVGDKDSEARDAIFNPIGFKEGAISDSLSIMTGLVDNLNNFTGNAVDVLFNGKNSDTAKYLSETYAREDLNPAEKAYELAKYPFQDSNLGMIDAVFGKGTSHQAKQDIFNAQKELDSKAQLQSEYGVGSGGYNAGKFTSEVAAYAFPAIKAEKYIKGIGGTLQRTKKAFSNNGTKLDVARAVAGDSLQNAGMFGSTEFLLGKAYGKSDEEATSDAMIASVLGLGGTPLVAGGGRAIGKLFDSAEADMAKQAGGGRPEDFGEGFTTQEAGFGSGLNKLFTKAGEEIESREVKETLQELEKREYEIVEPRAELGEELDGQAYVPEVKNDKKFEYSFDRNGRIYVSGSHLLDPQGTPDMKASIKMIVKDEVDSAKDEVNRRLEFYDNNANLQERYGQAQTKLKPEQYKEELTSDFERRLERHNFELDQLKQIKNDKTYSQNVRQEARKEFNKLKKVNLKDKLDAEVKEVAKNKFEKQFVPSKSKRQAKRDADISQEYRIWKKGQGFTPKLTQAGFAISKNIKDDLDAMKSDVSKATNFVIKEERKKGKTFDTSNITSEQKKAYPEQVSKIEEFQNLLSDYKAYKSKQIPAEELSFRAKRIVDERIAKEGDIEFKSLEEIEDYQKELIEMYNKYGVKARKSDINLDKIQKARENFGSNEKKTEKMELQSIQSQRTFYRKAFDRYKSNGRNSTIRTGENAGQKVLKPSHLKYLDSGLSTDEVLNIFYPLVSKAKAKEVKAQNRAKAVKKIQAKTAKEIGVKDRIGLPDDIRFSDTTNDASNSMMQMFTVLLGSKRLAKMSKLYGTDDDIRVMIGKEMEDSGFKLPDGDKTWKDYVKPIFMTEGYGQGYEGLIKTQMEKFDWSEPYARSFVDAYFKASDKLVPELVEVRKTLMDRMKSGDGNFEWTLPDGFKVKVKLTKKQDGKFAIKGKNIPFKLETESIDDSARALIPSIIHSVDSYVARRISKELNVQPNHDAFTIPKGLEDDLDRVYTKIMIQLNSGKDKDLLDNIFKQIGIDVPSVKVGDLPSSKIAESKFKLGEEHVAGRVEKSELRKFDVSKIGTKTEVMKDFMASGNYRQLPTNQLIDAMVNQANYNNLNLRKARTTDDVYERQLALAMQSPEFNIGKSLKVPDGIDVKTWNKAQREIFDEFRAKLEYNKTYNGVIQGKRKHFSEKGTPIGSNIKTYNEIIREEKRKLKAQYKKLKPNSKRYFTDDIQKNVHKPNEDRTVSIQEVIQESIKAESERVKIPVPKPKGKYKTLIDEQLSTSPLWREYSTLENMRHMFDTEITRTTEKVYDKVNKMTPEKKEDLSKLVWGNYEYIRGMTREQASEFESVFDAVYQTTRREIDQGVLGLKSHSEKYGAYLDNPKLIAERYDLSDEHVDIIGKLWAIKAMNHYKGWDVLTKYGDADKDLNYVLDTMGRNRDLSENILFVNNPQNMIFGYSSEKYLGNKTLTEDGRVVWDGEDKYEAGILGSERENKKIGDRFEDDIPKFKTLNDKLKWMKDNNLRQSNDTYRKVADEEIREELGRTYDLAEVLSETHRQTQIKIKEHGVIAKVLDDLSSDGSLLFSSKKKENMVELSDEQLEKLPYDLRGNLKYVNIDLIEKLVGRNEVRLYNGTNHNLKIADRLLSDLSKMFKQNVVLKNLTSFENSMLFNQAIGLSAGISPTNMYRYQRDAMKDLSSMKKLLELEHKYQLNGNSAMARRTRQKLKKNPLWIMERAGLSTNRVDGVVNDDDLLGSILREHVPSPIFRASQTLNLSQKTKAGRFTLSTFSRIDTMGRYMIVKHNLSKGMNMKDAVHDANGLFGNMDKMVPSAIQLLDKYNVVPGFVPFLKWFTLTSPRLIKMMKDNPERTIGAAVLIYMLGYELDLNLATVNPLEGMTDFFVDEVLPFGKIEEAAKLGLVDTALDRARSNVVPKYLNNAMRNPETMGLHKLFKDRIGKPFTDESADFRGFTQSNVDDFLDGE